MSEELHVLVEMLAASRGNAAQIELPGFRIDPRRAQLRVPADDSCNAERIVMRGVVSHKDLEALRHDTRVVDVYLDTHVAPFPDILSMRCELPDELGHSRFE